MIEYGELKRALDIEDPDHKVQDAKLVSSTQQQKGSGGGAGKRKTPERGRPAPTAPAAPPLSRATVSDCRGPRRPQNVHQRIALPREFSVTTLSQVLQKIAPNTAEQERAERDYRTCSMALLMMTGRLPANTCGWVLRDLKSAQCRFESDWGHRVTGAPTGR
jgi:hypothetical protein